MKKEVEFPTSYRIGLFLGWPILFVLVMFFCTLVMVFMVIAWITLPLFGRLYHDTDTGKYTLSFK